MATSNRAGNAIEKFLDEFAVRSMPMTAVVRTGHTHVGDVSRAIRGERVHRRWLRACACPRRRSLAHPETSPSHFLAGGFRVNVHQDEGHVRRNFGELACRPCEKGHHRRREKYGPAGSARQISRHFSPCRHRGRFPDSLPENSPAAANAAGAAYNRRFPCGPSYGSRRSALQCRCWSNSVRQPRRDAESRRRSFLRWQ